MLEDVVNKIIKEKFDRQNYLNIRVDKTVPTGIKIGKRICNENCIFDKKNNVICHDDNFSRNTALAASNSDMLRILEQISEAVQMKLRVHIAGDGEPTLLNEELVLFVKMLRGSSKVHKIKLTTNGTMLKLGTPCLITRLKEAGLDSINVSLHTLNKTEFIRVTGIDALDTVLKGVREAINANIEVSINCTVREKTLTEIDDFLKFSEETGIKIKFFRLLNDDVKIQNKYDALLDKLNLILTQKAQHIKHYNYPYNGQIFIINGSIVDVKDSRKNTCPNMACSYRNICTEGCRYEARLSGSGILQPCGVRTDNLIDLKNKIESKNIILSLEDGGKLPVIKWLTLSE
jgi:cyclic pyranopterin phosphate synthase